ncbi:hypothetical protein RDI58_003697 [Solanum bulbocastanum]|uniref:EF-hand domain-containing protein n=1 Tax=Solanum bulbocastanum TaxID=147425 RepID=A0AAN8U681_SOLBU
MEKNEVMKMKSSESQVMDGSDIMKLVGNEAVFSNFVDHKFQQLDIDKDGKLSVKELQPAVADIGVALGLPPQGSSPESDHIYSEVLQEFTHGKQEKVSKTEFKEVLSDILLGMAAGLKRDPIVLLRMDGEDLLEFVKSPAFEPEMLSLYSELELPDGSLKDYIIKAFEKLTVDQGMPPASDSWVMSNVVEPVVESCIGVSNEQPVTQETFLAEFKKVAESAAQRLKEQPVIVAHSENTFDGSGIKRLLSNKFELDKTLDSSLKTIPRDRHGKMSKEYLRVALDVLSPSAGLPPIGAVDQMDKVIQEVCKMLDADDGKMVKEEEFKKLLTEILGSMMLQLEGNPVSVSTNSVVHEPLASSSTLLQPPSISEIKDHGLDQWTSVFSLDVDCYDPLDPIGNISVTYDIVRWTEDGYQARITIQNYYKYRHIEKLGWQLGWTWAANEVIWSMSGAFATQQGNCSAFKSEIPHCCKKNPIIVDLAPEAPPEKRSDGCCHGGLLAASAINPSNSFASFEMKVGNIRGNYTAHKPLNLTLMAPGPGYTCDEFIDTDPTTSLVIEGQRQEQVIRTWKSTCTYSTFLANNSPTCCVSLSTFYNPEVTPCNLCSCGCKLADNEAKSCIGQSSSSPYERELLQCTDHMCPIRVHWHIKKNYRKYWRVKLTVSNYNLDKNYSNWNLVVQHPGFSQQATVFSFNNTMLSTVGVPDEVALFWGLDFYNDALLQAEEKQVGSVTTEILLLKDMTSFTLSNGWAFPRRIYFNGENCEMPLPQTFPMLPNGCSREKPCEKSSIMQLPWLKRRNSSEESFHFLAHEYIPKIWTMVNIIGLRPLAYD